MDLINRWLVIVGVVVVILLLVHPNSNAKNVIGSLSNQSIGNLKSLQGNAPGPIG